MYLGEINPLVKTVATQAVKYGAQYGASMLGYGSFAGPIGIAVGFLSMTFGLLMRERPDLPWFQFGIALRKEKKTPNVGDVLLAGSNFRLVSPSNASIPNDGAIVMMVDEGDFPQVFKTVEQSTPKIEEYQRKILTPFFITLTNLTAERQAAVIQAVMKPPLWVDQDATFKAEGVGSQFTVWGLRGGEFEGGMQHGIVAAYNYLVTILNDAFLRRIYLSVLDSPVIVPESYGDPIPRSGQEPAELPAQEAMKAVQERAAAQGVAVPMVSAPGSGSGSGLMVPLLIGGVLILAARR